ncbi:MAG: hypothetical protein J1D77_04580 [Muribaculaceae bacterium]|nr:hypothetical protein [Muribaculaceae bacterium]
MEATDLLQREDEVKVVILGPEGDRLYESTSKGFHNLETAINTALENANLNVDPEDCVFEVSNLSTGVSHEYRINAHGHLKLIV